MDSHEHEPKCWKRYTPCCEHHRHDYYCGTGELAPACPEYIAPLPMADIAPRHHRLARDWDEDRHRYPQRWGRTPHLSEVYAQACADQEARTTAELLNRGAEAGEKPSTFRMLKCGCADALNYGEPAPDCSSCGGSGQVILLRYAVPAKPGWYFARRLSKTWSPTRVYWRYIPPYDGNDQRLEAFADHCPVDDPEIEWGPHIPAPADAASMLNSQVTERAQPATSEDEPS